MIELKIVGTADEVHDALKRLFRFPPMVNLSASELSGVSSDKPAEAKTGEIIPPPPVEPAKRGRKKTVAPDVAETTAPLAISTGEEREPPETVQQDAADEAEDTEKARDPEKPLTIDDIKAEVNRYVEKWTFPAAKWDLQFVWREATGGKADRLSQLVDLDQPTMKTVIEATRKATDAKERRADGIAAQKAAEEAAAAKAKAA